MKLEKKKIFISTYFKTILQKNRDLEANLKGNGKYNKKWTVISNISQKN